MGSFFVNPAFVAAGTALIASPIIIHIINRLRYRRVRFAAMEFLLQSQQKNRRRILIEQLILLLLRILLVLLVMLLIARLILSPTQLSLLQGKAASHHVILIDDSGSMQEIAGEENVFSIAKKKALQLVERGAKEPGTQRVTILLLSKPNTALFRDMDANQEFYKRAVTAFENVKCTHQRLDLAAGMKVAGELLTDDRESRTSIKHLHVISDFRADDWKTTSGFADTVERLTENAISVNLIRTVKDARPNLAVTRLTGEAETAAAGVPMFIRIGVTNFGTKPVENVPVRIYADGKRLPRVVLFEVLEPGVEKVKPTYVFFDAPGPHRLRVELPLDALQTDNVRYLAVEDLPAANRVLLIDGDPAAKDAQFIADALAAEPKISGVEVEVHDPDWIRRNPLDRFQCIYLLNVPQLADDAIRPLRAYVESGGGLAWFAGNLVNAAHYNDKLYEFETETVKDKSGKIVKRAGRVTGLFPVPLGIASESLPKKEETSTAADVNVAGLHPIFKALIETKVIDMLKVSTWWPVAKQIPRLGGEWEKDDNRRKDGVETVATLRNGEPFVFSHQLGKGRIVTCLTTAGTAWNDWATLQIYVPIQLEIRRLIARKAVDRQRIVGRPIDESLPAAVYSDSMAIGTPDQPGQYTPLRATVRKPAPDEKQDAVRKTAEKSGKSQSEELYGVTFSETDTPGVYSLVVNRHKAAGGSGSTRDERMYAYNVPVEESATQLIPTEDIRKAVPNNKNFKVYDPDDETVFEGQEPGQEIRRILLVLLVLLLIAEQLLAYRLSYHTREA
jgi:Aerotolerance regulator N-terminal/von Willebrand factor type A domain